MQDAIRTGLAILKPFDPRARGAGLLSGSSTQSYKASAIIKADIAIPQNCQNLSVMVNPSPYSDMPQVWFNNNDDSGLDNSGVLDYVTAGSGPTFTYNDQVAASAPIQTVGLTCKALPFIANDAFGNIAQYGPNYVDFGPPNVRARVVSAQLKLTFTGNTLADSGVGYSLTDPQHENLQLLTVQNYLSQYTSTKPKKLATRQELELHFAPVTDKMMQFSEPYEDVLVSNGNGCAVSNGWGGTAATTSAAVDGGNSFPQGVLAIDCVKNARAVSTMLYPLSRRNQLINNNVSTATYTIASISSTGQITWTGQAPDPSQNGCRITPVGVSTIPVWFRSDLCLHWSANNWFLCFASGFVVTSTFSGGISFPVTVNILTLNTTPAILGAIILKGIAAMSSVHIEYVVHCEYIGVAIQGRQTGVIPNPNIQHMLMQILDDAREKCGQEEGDHKHLHHHAVDSIIKVAGEHAPGYAEALATAVCPEAAPVIDTLMKTAGVKRALGSAGAFLSKRFKL